MTIPAEVRRTLGIFGRNCGAAVYQEEGKVFIVPIVEKRSFGI